jgi:hypothetical protein
MQGQWKQRMKPQPTISCQREAMAALRHAHRDSFSLDPGDIKSLSLGAIWEPFRTLVKEQGSFELVSD